MTGIRDVLLNPAVAVVLGVFVGVCLVAPFLWAFRFATADKAEIAPIATLIAMMGGIIVGVGLLYGYGVVAREGFVWFGPSVIGGFVVGLGVMTVIVIRRWTRSDDETRS